VQTNGSFFFDTENSVNNFFDVSRHPYSKPIINFLTIYGGVTGDLKPTLTKQFSEENPT
jgi:hypothetical protein